MWISNVMKQKKILYLTQMDVLPPEDTKISDNGPWRSGTPGGGTILGLANMR